jgi:hypothetical protein
MKAEIAVKTEQILRGSCKFAHDNDQFVLNGVAFPQ